jgi:predicted SAM-dependent methyltransferase
MNQRARELLRDLPLAAKIIEIGPSLNPIAPKREGRNVTIVDHATREGLVEKYLADPNVDPSMIEEVDLVWHSGAIEDLIDSTHWGTYDAFIASHVIEHTTDVIAFLRSARKLLRDDGVVILAIPDKRKCFDFFRPLSTTSDAVAAYIKKRQRHTAKTHFDYAMYQAKRNDATGWKIDETAEPVMMCHIADGLSFAARAQEATT